MLLAKIAGAAGAALALALAGWFGFDPGDPVHTEQARFGVRLAMVYIPGALLLVTIVLIALQPINAKRHAIIARRLAARQQRFEASQQNAKPAGNKIEATHQLSKTYSSSDKSSALSP